MAAAFISSAQKKPLKSSASFELGSGLNFQFNDSAYQFTIGGMVQPYIGMNTIGEADPDYYFNSRRSYFNLGGAAIKEKVSFFVQLDFSSTDPLLDAWIGLHPTQNLNIYIGQKQNIANNREMLLMETHLQYPGRSLVSSEFSRSGREMGIFADYRIGIKKVGIIPQLAITSGDGRNSFGTDSRDIDLGGFKYAARLDVYPLGFFSKGNDKSIGDLVHEESLKFVIGAAASYNDGASDAVGEGHGNFALFDIDGSAMQPDYRQLYGDILMKYRGFSFLGEYVVATATQLEGIYTSPTASDALLPAEISEYLALGTGYNVQAGYVLPSKNYGIDARYFGLMPEFDQNAGSLTQEQSGWSLGVSKYFIGNACKLQAAYTSLSSPTLPESNQIEILFQVVF